MWRKSLIVALLLAFSVMLLSGPAWTACPDLEGTWSAEIWAGDPSGTQYWDQCVLMTVDSGGFIQAGGTYFTTRTGETSDVTGGQLTMNANCEIEGTIETSDGTVYVEHGAVAGDRLFLGVPE